ncbi:MAG: TRAP transporter large permease subunit [Desulforhopalus sp.]
MMDIAAPGTIIIFVLGTIMVASLRLPKPQVQGGSSGRSGSIAARIEFFSPPFGPAAFYLKSVAPPDITFRDIFASVWPFIIMQLMALALVVLNPGIALWLVNL